MDCYRSYDKRAGVEGVIITETKALNSRFVEACLKLGRDVVMQNDSQEVGIRTVQRWIVSGREYDEPCDAIDAAIMLFEDHEEEPCPK